MVRGEQIDIQWFCSFNPHQLELYHTFQFSPSLISSLYAGFSAVKIYPGKFAKVARKPEKTFIRCFILWQLKTFYTLKLWCETSEQREWNGENRCFSILCFMFLILQTRLNFFEMSFIVIAGVFIWCLWADLWSVDLRPLLVIALLGRGANIVAANTAVSSDHTQD